LNSTNGNERVARWSISADFLCIGSVEMEMIRKKFFSFRSAPTFGEVSIFHWR
jgi:hypothetical protein